MATGVNKVILIGNLGADPDSRFLPSGTQVCNFRIATTEKFKDQERTEWHNIVTFGKLAEICGTYLVKGKKVYIEGRLQTKVWTDKEGVERRTTEIIANDMQMLSYNKDSGSAPNPRSVTNSPESSSAQGNTAAEEDDIPF